MRGILPSSYYNLCGQAERESRILVQKQDKKICVLLKVEKDVRKGADGHGDSSMVLLPNYSV